MFVALHNFEELFSFCQLSSFALDKEYRSCIASFIGEKRVTDIKSSFEIVRGDNKLWFEGL